MGEEKGKLTKKLLHIGHLIIGFLRNVVKPLVGLKVWVKQLLKALKRLEKTLVKMRVKGGY